MKFKRSRNKTKWDTLSSISIFVTSLWSMRVPDHDYGQEVHNKKNIMHVLVLFSIFTRNIITPCWEGEIYFFAAWWILHRNTFQVV